MDSLLANYGSDEEDADSPAASPKPAVVKTTAARAPSWNRQSLFGALPPPKNSAAESSSSLWDDEDEGEPVKPLRMNSVSNARDNWEKIGPPTSLFTSLPRPGDSAVKSSLWDDEDEPLRRPKREIGDTESYLEQTAPATSFFSSLPPPKLETVNWVDPPKVSAKTPKLEPVDNDGVEKNQSGPHFSDLITPKHEPATLPSGFFDNASSVADGPPQQDDIPEGLSSSLFAKVPPPASSSTSKALFGKLPLPSTSKAKPVREFRPPINYALLETKEEDDLEKSRKRSKLTKENDRATEPKVGEGLIAFLPPPKNSLGSGAALGGGGSQGGRRTVMETASDPYNMARENAGDISRRVEKTELKAEVPAVGVSHSGYGAEPAVQSGEVSYGQPDGGYYDPQDGNAQQAYAPYEYGTGHAFSVGNGYGEQSWQYPEANAYGAASQQSQGSAPVQVLAEVIKKERRKGRDEPPPQMIEVKQADLTGGSKVREDQMHTTGIAFGPNYKPAASNKDKPSKLHRRKHQIGALYFDMKQNEMNLLDRRAKGNLTKAETQAKYGW
ncbi:unnamed protein product [Calypogeia fissa]